MEFSKNTLWKYFQNDSQEFSKITEISSMVHVKTSQDFFSRTRRVILTRITTAILSNKLPVFQGFLQKLSWILIRMPRMFSGNASTDFSRSYLKNSLSSFSKKLFKTSPKDSSGIIRKYFLRDFGLPYTESAWCWWWQPTARLSEG